MNVCSPRNPNVCVDCEALTLDDSPSTLPGQTEVGPPSHEFAQPYFSANAFATGQPGTDAVGPDYKSFEELNLQAGWKSQR
jgi:hypothetical protein